MDSRAFELLIKLISENKTDSVKRHDEMRDEIAEIKKLCTENTNFRMKLIGGSLAVNFLIGLLWHYLELKL